MEARFPRQWGDNFWMPKKPAPPPPDGRLLKALAGAERSGVLLNPNVQAAFATWRANPDDPVAEALVRDAITAQQVEHAHYPFDPAPPDVLDGEGVLLGVTIDGTPVRVPLRELLPGIAFGASSGSGKTVLFYSLAVNNRLDAVHVIDFWGGKDSWRGLVPLYCAQGREFIVLPWKRARINLFDLTDGVPREDTIGDLADDLRDGIGIPDHSMLYVRSALRNAEVLTPQCVGAQLREQDAKWKDAAIEKIAGISEYFPDELVKGWTMRDLSTRSIVWELGGLDQWLQAFITMRLVRSAFRQNVHDKTARTLVFVVDEANRVFNEGTAISALTSTVRASGIGFALGFQGITGTDRISQLVVDNMPVRVLGRIGSAQSFTHFAGSLGIHSQNQLDYARRTVRPGQVLVKLPQWHDPIVLCYPNLTPPAVPAEEVEASLAPLLALPVVKRRAAVEIDERAPPPDRGRVSDTEHAFLLSVCDYPFTHQTDLYKRLGGRADGWTKVKDKLVTAGYVRPYVDALGSARGRPRTYLEPLPAAFALLGRERPTHGRGGFAHALYTRLVGRQLEVEGFLVGYEHALNTGQSCDVYATRDDVALAVEVELSARHRDNLKKVVHHAVTHLVVVAPPLVLPEVQKAARAILGPPDLDRVTFLELSAALNAARLIPNLIPLPPGT